MIQLKKSLQSSVLLFCLVFPFSARAQVGDYTAAQVIDGGILTLEKTQMKNDSLYFDGEWPAQMRSYMVPALLGVGRLWAQPVEEPTAFVSSAMAKVLYELYQVEPSKSIIPVMAKKALDSTAPYRVNESYAYYTEAIENGVQVRGPRATHYVPNYIKGMTHVPTDTDTTSVTFAAFLQWQPGYKVPEETFEHMALFRDVDRKSHYYNAFRGVKNTGAFLTWQIDDQDPNMPRGLFDRPEKGPRIPFGVNDVDCVVNANALHFMTLAKHFDAVGYKDACELVNEAVLRGQQYSCGIYYPNQYALFFNNSLAYKDGATCIEKSRAESIQFLLSNQATDGSWTNKEGVGRPDQVQSTALSMLALMNFYGERARHDTAIRSSLSYGARFLMSKVECEETGACFWTGEVFFSAVSQARNTVLWRSTPYTTALATLALAKARALGLTE
jgi:hypothetical protein